MKSFYKNKEADAALKNMNEKQLNKYGCVFEKNLKNITNVSVGGSQINNDIISYVGTQRELYISESKAEYVGSDIVVVRGDYQKLLQVEPMADNYREAIRQTEKFHKSLTSCYKGIIASRLNVDVIQGYDQNGYHITIASDPSLRVGGTPEIHALSFFKQHPETDIIYASSYQGYYDRSTEKPQPPKDAIIHFHGEDKEFKPGKVMMIYSAVSQKLLKPHKI